MYNKKISESNTSIMVCSSSSQGKLIREEIIVGLRVGTAIDPNQITSSRIMGSNITTANF